jgi:hypothetical protein
VIIRFISTLLLLLIYSHIHADINCIAWDKNRGDPLEQLIKNESMTFVIAMWEENGTKNYKELFSKGYQSIETAKKNLKKIEGNPYFYLRICTDNKNIKILQADVIGNPIPSEIITRQLFRWQ